MLSLLLLKSEDKTQGRVWLVQMFIERLEVQPLRAVECEIIYLAMFCTLHELIVSSKKLNNGTNYTFLFAILADLSAC